MHWAKTLLLIGLAVVAVVWLRSGNTPRPIPYPPIAAPVVDNTPPTPTAPAVSTHAARPGGWYAEGSAPEDSEPSPEAEAPKKRAPLTQANNGNSVFATNLLAGMTPPEYAAYLKHFVAVMEDGETDATYEWTTQRAIGNIIPGEPFLAATNQYCRSFSESYTVGEQAQLLSGVACRNGHGGWCKLRKESTYDCGLQKPGGVSGMMLDTSVALQNMGTGWQRTQHSINSFRGHLPSF